MKWSTFSFLAIFFVLILTLGHPAQAALELKDTSWRVMEIGGYPVAAGQSDREPHLVFSGEGRVSGSSGCNRFTGVYQQDGKSLHFSPMAMTKMACPPPLEALERAFIQALAGTVSMRESGKTLELQDATGKVQMVLQSR